MKVPEAILDASAVLAFALDEPGGAMVTELVGSAAIPAPNWTEVLTIIQRRKGGQPKAAGRTLKSLGLWVEPVAEDDAELAADLASSNPGLSLGDRFCLAVAERLARPAYTTDRAWAQAATKAEVVLIR